MTADRTAALEAAQVIADHQPNKHGWGYTADVLLVARALLSTAKEADRMPETCDESVEQDPP